MVGQPRVLVLTLSTDEPQLERCVDSVRAQKQVTLEHRIISGLGNAEAHRELYATIESRASEFDVFVKVDADMVLAGDAVLGVIAGMFRRDPELDHVQLAIDDFYTDEPIMGVHAFSPRASWPRTDEQLFVDASPLIPGRRAVLWKPPVPIAVHSPDPSPWQAFRFGVHRASKAFQHGRSRFRGSQAREQWRTLTRTWDAFLRHGDAERGLTTYAADLVWRNAIELDEDGYRGEIVDGEYWSAPKEPDELRAMLEQRWRPGIRRSIHRLRALGVQRSAQLVGATLRQELQSMRAGER